MTTDKRRFKLPAPVAVFIVVHLVALSLTWAIATLVSRSHPDLSPQGGHIRLVSVTSSR